MELNVTFQWAINKEKNITTETDVRILAMSYVTYKIGELIMTIDDNDSDDVMNVSPNLIVVIMVVNFLVHYQYW